MRGASWRLTPLLFAVACVPAFTAPAPAASERLALRHLVDSLLAAPELRHSRWGVLIVDPEAGDTLYSRDAGKLFVPASNQKILTTALALETFGPDHRFRTLLLGGAVRDGVLESDLHVVGLGDPGVSDHVSGDAMLPLRAAAGAIAARGITAIRGRVTAERFDAFPDANAGFGWQLEDLDAPYGAVVDELLFNEGFSVIHVRGGRQPGDAVSVRTAPARSFPVVRVEARTVPRGPGRDSVAQLKAVKDSATWEVVVRGTVPPGDSVSLNVTHRDPRSAYLAALREALEERGVAIRDSLLPYAEGAPLDTLFVLESPPLSLILQFFMKPSQNQIGEMLFKSVALARADTGTARVARRVFTEQLRAWSAEPDGMLLYDGSGLSRRNLVSPETIVRVLDAMRRSPHFRHFYDAFPVAGVDGTLRARMRGTVAEANVRGKTGTLGNVRSLSGYLTTSGGRLLIFSMLSNNFLVGVDHVSRVQDSIAVRATSMRLPAGPPAMLPAWGSSP